MGKKGLEEDLSEAQQNLAEAKEIVKKAEREGNTKSVAAAKKKLLKAENALERDAKLGDSKSKKRESAYDMTKSQKKEKSKEVRTTKKLFRDAKETFEIRRKAERKQLAKVFVGDSKKSVQIIGKIVKIGKESEMKLAQQKMKIAMKSVQISYKKNSKGFGDKRSMAVAIAQLKTVSKILSSTKDAKEEYKEDIN